MFEAVPKSCIPDIVDKLHLDPATPITIVSQEPNNDYLFYWVTPTGGTRIGVYEAPSDPRVHTRPTRVIWTTDEPLHIVNMTINEERTLLAFVIYSRVHSVKDNSGRKISTSGNPSHSLRVVELTNSETSTQTASKEVCGKFLDSQEFIKVHFLRRDARDKTRKAEAHLLIMVHYIDINLFHLPCKEVAPDEWKLCSDRCKELQRREPSETRFFWAQWEAKNNTLFYMYQWGLKIVLEAREFSVSHDSFFRSILHVVVLEQSPSMRGPPLRNLLGQRLTLQDIMAGQRFNYFHTPLSDIISDDRINARIMTKSDGCFYLCFQLMKAEKKANARLTYSVVALHHLVTQEVIAHDAVVPFEPNVRELVHHSPNPNRVLFLLLDHYVLAVLPGVFMHMLDLGCEHVLPHHIFLTPAHFSGLSRHMHLAPIKCGSKMPHCYEINTQTILSLSIGRDNFVHTFCTTSDHRKRLALVHYAAVHETGEKQVMLGEKIVGCMADDIACLEVTNMLSEFIVGSASRELRTSVREKDPKVRALARLFPAICPELEGQIDSIETPQHVFRDDCDSGGFFANASVSRIHDIGDTFGTPKKASTTWKATYSLNEKARLDMRDQISTKVKNGRLSLAYLTNMAVPEKLKFKKKFKPMPLQPGLQFIHLEAAHSPMAFKLLKTVSEVCSEAKKANLHITASDSVLEELCDKYCQFVLDAAVKVLGTFWKSCGMSQEVAMSLESEKMRACQFPDHGERLLLECLMKTSQAVEQLGFQMPNGFDEFFACLGLRCYPYHYYLTLLDVGLFKFSAKLAQYAMRDLDDSPESSIIKHEMLARLESISNLAEQSSKLEWNTSIRISSDLQLSRKLNEDSGKMEKSRGDSRKESVAEDSRESYDLVKNAQANFDKYAQEKMGRTWTTNYLKQQNSSSSSGSSHF